VNEFSVTIDSFFLILMRECYVMQVMEKINETEWTEKMAAHLLKRAAFSATPKEISSCHKLGMKVAVADILKGQMPGTKADPKAKPLNPPTLLPLPPLNGQKPKTGKNAEQAAVLLKRQKNQQILFTLQYDWLLRMYSPSAPLEKLVLFWHGMLTSAYGKVNIASFMVRQNELYREFAYGDYRELIKRVVMDPAMIIYLDIDKNKRLSPNENFARELLEMFTLGEGNYKPELIKEIAKEMVGYWVKKPENKLPVEEADKKGMEANSGYADKRRRLSRLIDSIFGLPVSGQLLCRRLWKFYVSNEEPSKEILYQLTKTLKQSRWNVAAVLNEIFTSKAFYSSEAMGQQIKSPVQFLLQGHREIDAVTIDLKSAYYTMQKLGQSLFNPPNVSGWPAGETWINGSTLSARYELSTMMVNLIDKQRVETADYYFERLKTDKLRGIEEMIGFFFAVPLPAKKAKILLMLAERITTREQTITLIEYIMCMPEYQLC